MTWLDSFLANPAIGVAFQPIFPGAIKLRDVAISYLDEKYTDLMNKLSFLPERPYDVRFETPTGFAYSVGLSEILIEHKYIIKQNKPGGKLPTIAPTELLPYSDLFLHIQNDIKDIWKILAKNCGEQLIKRVGVVAKCSFDRSEMPPGLEQLLNHLGKPWPLGLSSMQGALTATLFEDDNITERVHHNIRFNTLEENEDVTVDEVVMTLDWQKLYQKPIQTKSIDTLIDEVSAKSQSYFESLGIGELDYE